MYGINYEKPRNLTEAEWEKALAVFKAVPRLQYAIEVLRARDNEPTSAELVLPAKILNQGNEQHNNYFRNAKMPLRLTRVGGWGYKNERTRNERKLALVPWDNEKGKPIAPTSADIPRIAHG